MRITLSADGKSIVFELNDSQAAKDLYAQLPLSVDVEDYGGKEKIYYPPKKLKTANTPLVGAAHPGTLAYYAPWGDVVMFYGSFGSAAGLYELGVNQRAIWHRLARNSALTVCSATFTFVPRDAYF